MSRSMFESLCFCCVVMIGEWFVFFVFIVVLFLGFWWVKMGVNIFVMIMDF